MLIPLYEAVIRFNNSKAQWDGERVAPLSMLCVTARRGVSEEAFPVSQRSCGVLRSAALTSHTGVSRQRMSAAYSVTHHEMDGSMSAPLPTSAITIDDGIL